MKFIAANKDKLLRLILGFSVVRVILTLLLSGFLLDDGMRIFPFLISALFWLGQGILLYVICSVLIRFNYLFIAALLCYVTILIALLWTIADPIVVMLAGDHLTPALLAHFAGPQIFLSDELWLPIVHWWYVVLPLLVIAIWLIMATFKQVKLVIHHADKGFRHRYSISLLMAVFLMGTPFTLYGRFVMIPPEVIFLKNALKWDLHAPTTTDFEFIYSYFLNSDEVLVDPDFPLMVQSRNTEKQQQYTHVIILEIESLRGEFYKSFNSGKGNMEMSSFSRFAAHGITYPFFISNGFPSTEGFSSIAMGVWPHAKDRLVISHQDKYLPSLARIMAQAGYETYRIEDYKDMEEEGYWCLNTFDHYITYWERNIIPSEQNMMDDLLRILQNRDSTDRPVYVHLKTRNPHYPYEITNETNSGFYQIGTPSENYKKSMEIIDIQLIRLVSYLDSENLWDKTMVVLCGDHANYMDKLHLTSLPTDETVWTGAIIAAQGILAVQDSVSSAHVSQVDIMATLVDTFNPGSPRMIMGRNLFTQHADEQHSISIAIRPSGVRINSDSGAWIVSRNNPFEFLPISAFGKTHSLKSMPAYKPQQLLSAVDRTYLLEKNQVWNH